VVKVAVGVARSDDELLGSLRDVVCIAVIGTGLKGVEGDLEGPQGIGGDGDGQCLFDQLLHHPGDTKPSIC
jgi:hypothetical protein